MQKILYGPLHNQARQYLLKQAREYVSQGRGDKFCYLAPTPQLLNDFKEGLIEPLEISGTGGLHLYLFEGLFNELLKETGNYRETISPLEQEIILHSILQRLKGEDKIVYFKEMIGFTGFYKGLIDLLKEFKEGGNNPFCWQEKAKNTKERELGLIFSEYFKYLKENRLLDEGLKIEEVFKLIKAKTSFFKTIEFIIVDGFQKFTGNQYRFLRFMADLKLDLLINLKYDKDRPELYENVETVFDSLDFETKYFSSQDACQKSKVLAHLEENLFKLEVKGIQADHSLQLFESPERDLEVEQLARECKRLIFKGVSPEEIGIIVRKPDIYLEPIENIFTELGVPYNFTKGIPFIKTPVWKTVVGIFQAINTNLERKKVLNLLKSNLLNFLKIDEYDQAEEIINKAKIMKGKDWYRLRSHDHDYLKDKILQLIEDLQDFRTELQGKRFFKEFAQSLWAYLMKAGLKEGILNEMELNWLARDLMSLESLKETLLKLSELIPYKLKKGDFLYWLKRALNDKEIKLKKESGSRVAILTPSQARGKEFKYLFMIGLIEGEFPAREKKDWLFNSEEREKLRERGIFLFDQSHQLTQERFFFYSSLSAAKERVYLSYPSLGARSGGRLISSFVQEVKKLFDEKGIKTERITGYFPPPGSLKEAISFKEAVDFYLYYSSEGELSRLLPAYQAEAKRWGKSYTKWDGYLVEPQIKDEIKARYQKDYVYSASELETYANCPFKFFARRILSLKEPEEPLESLNALDLGNLYHRILYHFFQDYFPGNWEKKWSEYEVALEKAALDIFLYFPNKAPLPQGMWELYQEEILSKLKLLLKSEWWKKGYLPEFLELGFGLNEGLKEDGSYNYTPSVSIDISGEVINFRGKIDRIDLSADKRKALIWDYKLGNRKQSYQKMLDGFDLQLPLYIMVAQEILPIILGDKVEFIGAGYYSVHKNEKDGVWRAKYEDLIPVSSRAKNCLTEEEWEETLSRVKEHIVNYLAMIRQADFRIAPVNCDYCDFRDICRFEPRRIGGFNG